MRIPSTLLAALFLALAVTQAAAQGSTLMLVCEGAGEAEAAGAVASLFAARFEEEE